MKDNVPIFKVPLGVGLSEPLNSEHRLRDMVGNLSGGLYLNVTYTKFGVDLPQRGNFHSIGCIHIQVARFYILQLYKIGRNHRRLTPGIEQKIMNLPI
jgi:hypothetical protein